MAKNPNWTAQELGVIQSMYGRSRVQTWMSAVPYRTKNAICLKARSLGLVADRSCTHKRYEIDASYFEQPTLENSYWAGFIAADGNIAKDKNRVRIKLQASDSSHLEAFRAACRTNVQVRDAWNGPRQYRVLDISGVPKWVSDLRINFNITPAKTFTLCPPDDLSWQCRLAFIIGYIDGDGCIYVNRPPRGRASVGITMIGTYQMLSWIKSAFDAIAESQNTVRAVKSVFAYKIVGHSAAVAVASRLLNVQVPRLERKWNIARQFVT